MFMYAQYVVSNKSAIFFVFLSGKVDSEGDEYRHTSAMFGESGPGRERVKKACYLQSPKSMSLALDKKRECESQSGIF